MADYTLHCFVESGNAYKAALMLSLINADYETKWVDFFNGGSRSPEFRELNAMGEVPVLIDHTEGDLVVTQSGVILHHLADKSGMFGAETPQEKRDVLRWMFFDNHKLTGYIATYRFLRKFMKKEGEPETEFLKGRAIAALKTFDRHLEGRDWVAAKRPTIADISCCGYLFWPDDFGVSWDDYPGIAQWLKRMQSLDNWAPPEDLLPSGPDNNT